MFIGNLRLYLWEYLLNSSSIGIKVIQLTLIKIPET